MTVVDSVSWGGFGAVSGVSILVVVDDGRRLGTHAQHRYIGTSFQSLLLWMTVVDTDSNTLSDSIQ